MAELDREMEDIELERRAQGRQSAALAEVMRLANTIRAQVAGYRKTHEDWEQEFNSWFGLYQSEGCRDDQWYKKAERVYKQRIEEAEASLSSTVGPPHPHAANSRPVVVSERTDIDDIRASESDVAMAIVNLARLYQEQGKFLKAATCYRRALKSYEAASIPDRVRELVLPWIKAQISKCKDRKKADAVVSIRLPL